ncbi:MAG TPA: hypothetical protein VHS31_14205 [Tepidisphaeraceae bacterium]|nr:hypothetical protein [Tepidisphaeraceae bacterium]
MKPVLESLESRQLFAAVAPIIHVTKTGTLMIQGTTDDDTINVFLVGGIKEKGIGITFKYKLDGSSDTNTIVTHERFNTVKRILIDAGAGDDKITLTGPLASDPSSVTVPVGGNVPPITLLPIPATVLGGAGDDSIGQDLMGPLLAVGGAGNDTLSSGSVDQILVNDSKNSDVLDQAFQGTGSQSPCTLMGGAGDDVLIGNINDQVDGGAGVDTGRIVIKAPDLSTANSISVDRGDALAHDYYQRLGATSLEQATAPTRVVTNGGTVAFGPIKNIIGNA